MTETAEREALLISGTVGAGKTTAAGTVAARLRAHGVPHAVIDLDWLRAARPSPPNDRFNLSIEVTNLAAVAANYLNGGANRLVLAGVLEDPAMSPRYRQAVGVPLHVARLRVGIPLARQRLHRRRAGHTTDLGRHLRRAGELHDILEAAAAEDFIVDTDELNIEQTAAALIVGAGWETTASPR